MVDHIQTIRTFIEKSTEYNVPLHLAFVDYQKVFDSEIWAVLEAKDRTRIDSRYTNLIRNIYGDTTLKIKIDKDLATKKRSLFRETSRQYNITETL